MQLTGLVRDDEAPQYAQDRQAEGAACEHCSGARCYASAVTIPPVSLSSAAREHRRHRRECVQRL